MIDIIRAFELHIHSVECEKQKGGGRTCIILQVFPQSLGLEI